MVTRVKFFGQGPDPHTLQKGFSCLAPRPQKDGHKTVRVGKGGFENKENSDGVGRSDFPVPSYYLDREKEKVAAGQAGSTDLPNFKSGDLTVLESNEEADSKATSPGTEPPAKIKGNNGSCERAIGKNTPAKHEKPRCAQNMVFETPKNEYWKENCPLNQQAREAGSAQATFQKNDQQKSCLQNDVLKTMKNPDGKLIACVGSNANAAGENLDPGQDESEFSDGASGGRPGRLDSKVLLIAVHKIKEIKERRSDRIKNAMSVRSVGTEDLDAARKTLACQALASSELPHATFTPTQQERQRMAEVLMRRLGDPERRKLRRELGDAFRRIYTRYRRKLSARYECIQSEWKYAEEAGALCILKEVYPARLIGYWAENVGRFTSMKYPSLSFLSRSGIVDEVACLKDDSDRVRKFANNREPTPAIDRPETHAYANTDRLDLRLRPGLVSAGFDLTGMDDRYLMTVQSAAQAIAKGWPMYLPQRLKGMVEWAAANIYQGEKE